MMTVLATVAGLFVWVVLDLRAFMQWQTQLSSLSTAGRIEELVATCEAMVRTRRPVLRIFMRLFMPGGLEAMAASQLILVGRPRRALELAQQAERAGASKPNILFAAVATRQLAHLGLLQLEDAQRAWAQLSGYQDVPVGIRAVGATLLAAQGALQAALDLTKELLAKDPAEESAHLSAAAAASELGDFPAALAFLEYDPRPATHMHNPKDVAALQGDDAGRALLAAQEAERSSITRPSRHLQAAMVHVAAGDLNAAEFSLSNAQQNLGGHPAMAVHFHLTGMQVAAMAQDLQRFDRHVLDAQALVTRMGEARSLQAEAAVAKARALVALGRPTAVLETLDTLPREIFPLGRHHAAYLRGQALAALGRTQEARSALQEVGADGIPGIITQRAQDLLAALPG